MLLKNKTAIITGGGSGIGEETARLFASHGAKVVIADLNGEAGERVADEIREGTSEASAISVRCDVSKEDAVKYLLETVTEKYSSIDILVNNASVALPNPLDAITDEHWYRLMDINLKSVYLMIKYTIPELSKTKGSIVNMASLNGLLGQRGNAVYSATKGGVIALTKSAALDYAPDGIRVNCVCPAGVLTPLLESWIEQQQDSDAARRSLEEMHPLGRVATANDVAQTILFLASDMSRFVTGAALPVDGGASLGY